MTKDNVMGIRDGGGHDQYAGRVAGGDSGGGAYPNPHDVEGTADADAGNVRTDDGAGPRETVGGQSQQGYYGGGQAGDRGKGDHHAASRSSAPDDAGADYRDHPSQQDGPVREAFDAAVARAEKAVS